MANFGVTLSNSDIPSLNTVSVSVGDREYTEPEPATGGCAPFADRTTSFVAPSRSFDSPPHTIDRPVRVVVDETPCAQTEAADAYHGHECTIPMKVERDCGALVKYVRRSPAEDSTPRDATPASTPRR